MAKLLSNTEDNNDNEKQSAIVLDYDLDVFERMEIFQNYDFILCRKCNCKIEDKYPYYCNNCYERETDETERNRMKYGKCKECFQVLSIYNGCLHCARKHFQQDFDKWTSGNKGIDKLIQDNQLSVDIYFNILEWIPYNKFNDIKYIAEGGFAKVYSTTWSDGSIVKWDHKSNNWKRIGPVKVALKVFNNSLKNLSDDFVNEVCNININEIKYTTIRFLNNF